MQDRLGCAFTLAILLLLPSGVPARWITNHLDPAFAKHQQRQADYEAEKAAHEERLNAITVYATTYGERYHRGYHYETRNHAVGLGDALLRGLTPCQVCLPVSASKVSTPPDPLPPFQRSGFWTAAMVLIWAGLVASPFGVTKLIAMDDELQRQTVAG